MSNIDLSAIMNIINSNPEIKQAVEKFKETGDFNAFMKDIEKFQQEKSESWLT